jgi:hypothetical protein
MRCKNFATLYIEPNDCPDEVSNLADWELGAVKESIFNALVPYKKKHKHLEFMHQPGVFLSWTCAGCTKSFGENPCPQRRCTLGGKAI